MTLFDRPEPPVSTKPPVRTRLTWYIALMLLAINADQKSTLADQPSLESGRPNLILILADDLGFGDIGCHGSPEVRTPNIDRLASQGMLMTNMRANCTVCSPTRAALLSGRYADRVGVPGVIRTTPANNWGYFNPGQLTLPGILKDAGYKTAIVGKWHLGLESPNTPNEHGFDHFHGFLGDMMDDYYSHLRGGINFMRLNDKQINPEGHATELFTQWAIDYVDDHVDHESQTDAPEPFFLYLPYNAPHFPIQPPSQWRARVADRGLPASEERISNIAFVEHLDNQVGRLLDHLDKSGLRESTVVAFTSDNGGSLRHAQNNDPWRDGKQSHFDGGLRVPFLVRYPPEIKAGTHSEYRGLTFDLAATFLSYAGVDQPAEFDAVNLRDVLAGQSDDSGRGRDLYFVRREGGSRYGGLAYHAIISGRWKLLQNNPFSSRELYDLDSDPGELNNAIEKNRGIANKLSQKLARQIQRGGSIPWQPSSN